MMLKNKNKQLIITTILLIVVIAFFELTSFDTIVQNYFYNTEAQRWLINKKNPTIRFFMYDSIKILFNIFGITILLSLIFLRKNKFVKEYRQGLLIVLLSVIFVPLIAVTLKDITNMPCPCKIVDYGGQYPNIKLFESYPPEFSHLSRTRCWPAGHASIGFSLMSLYFLFKDPKHQKIALIGALLLGWSTGLYKMLIGDHFLSHTIITMLLAWIFILIIYSILNYKKDKNEKSTKV